MPAWRWSAMAALGALLLAAASAAAHGPGPAGSIASPLLAPGDTFTLVMDGPGSYQVHCHLHGSMTGTLTVLPAGTAMSMGMHDVTLVDDAFRDSASGGAHTTVHAGDTIMWRNAGNQTHDVHLTPVTAASVDNGSFEATVLVGLGVTLVAIFAISRRT